MKTYSNIKKNKSIPFFPGICYNIESHNLYIRNNDSHVIGGGAMRIRMIVNRL